VRCLSVELVRQSPVLTSQVTSLNMEQRWNNTDRENPEGLEEKSVPLPLFPPQIPYGLTRKRTQSSAVRNWRLTCWAMALAGPTEYH
jgi:hypothetical protein